jgi:dipeptidyl aminopeptidase/acylaminoacyl peptidase
MKAVGAPGVKIMVDDFESGIDALVAAGIADPARIGIFGFSNGGWVANLLVTETKKLAAAVVQSGMSNAISMALGLYVTTTRGMDSATGGNVFDNLDDYERLSPIFRMRDITTPMLLMVGDYDSIWVPQMIAQYSVLRAEGRDVTLVRYAGEGHIRAKRETALDAHRRVTEFFRQHLGVEGAISSRR